MVIGLRRCPHTKRALEAARNWRPRFAPVLDKADGATRARAIFRLSAAPSWPTLPLTFMDGKFLGGADELVAQLFP